jgi:hypothetical protein
MTLLNEIATLIASAPAPEQLLKFQPSDESRNRASKLL